MRIFVTGATGFIGSAVVPLLLKANHSVIGMTRSAEGTKALEAQGATPLQATLEDPESIKRGVEKADAVIHCAFDHDFSSFVENTQKDSRVIAAMGEVLKGSKRPLLITSGVGIGGGGHGQLAREDVFDDSHPNPRIATERAGNTLLDAGLNVSVMRLPQVHDTRKQGLITPLLDIFRQKGVAAYVGDGQNRWSAGHLSDVARAYHFAIERGEAGARYNAVGEEGVAAKDIAEALGRGLKVPVKSVTPAEAGEYFGWMGMFAAMDLAASSVITQAKLNWKPTGPGLIADLDAMNYG